MEGFVWSYPLYHHIPAKAIFFQMTAGQCILACSGGIQLGKSLAPHPDPAISQAFRRYGLLGLIPVATAWTSTQLPPEIGMASLVGGFGLALASDAWAYRQGLISKRMMYFKVAWTLILQISLGIPFVVYF